MQKWHISWNLRGQKYYAYLRNSQKIEGKVVTKNIYLGADLVSAETKLQNYLKENGIPDHDYMPQLRQLGLEKGVPHNLRQPIGRQFEEIRGLIRTIPDSMTIVDRQKLQKVLDEAIIKLWETMASPAASEAAMGKSKKKDLEEPVSVASPERILELYVLNKGMPRGKYKHIADILNSKHEYDSEQKSWTADSVKKALKKMIKKTN
jgi:hypothetical protein